MHNIAANYVLAEEKNVSCKRQTSPAKATVHNPETEYAHYLYSYGATIRQITYHTILQAAFCRRRRLPVQRQKSTTKDKHL